MKGWFGSKATCLGHSVSALEEVDLENGATVPANRFQQDVLLDEAFSCGQADYIKKYFRHEPAMCLDSESGITLAAALPRCSEIAWYSNWWNTIKGWFGSKATNCVGNIAFSGMSTAFDLKAKSACKDLAWYSRWWNTMKGWFGYKPTNCVGKLVIESTNENDAALQAFLAAEEADDISVHVSEPVDKMVGIDNFHVLDDVATSYTRDESAKVDLGLEEAPKDTNMNFFQLVAEVFRNKGLPMENYKTPVAYDLIDRMPSFTDSEPVNGFVKMMDAFAKAKTVILAQDKVDRNFLEYVEKYIMALATGAGKNLKDVIAKHAKLEGFMDNAKLN